MIGQRRLISAGDQNEVLTALRINTLVVFVAVFPQKKYMLEKLLTVGDTLKPV